MTDLFPGLTPEEQEEARAALRRYLDFVVRLHGRIASDPDERERFTALTREHNTRSMDDGRSFTSQIRDTNV